MTGIFANRVNTWEIRGMQQLLLDQYLLSQNQLVVKTPQTETRVCWERAWRTEKCPHIYLIDIHIKECVIRNVLIK